MIPDDATIFGNNASSSLRHGPVTTESVGAAFLFSEFLTTTTAGLVYFSAPLQVIILTAAQENKGHPIAVNQAAWNKKTCQTRIALLVMTDARSSRFFSKKISVLYFNIYNFSLVPVFFLAIVYHVVKPKNDIGFGLSPTDAVPVAREN